MDCAIRPAAQPALRLLKGHVGLNHWSIDHSPFSAALCHIRAQNGRPRRDNRRSSAEVFHSQRVQLSDRPKQDFCEVILGGDRRTELRYLEMRASLNREVIN
jgi:hypothetical protein